MLVKRNAENIISSADKTCQHIFNLLGSGPKNLSEAINWHQDFKSGKVWPWWLPQALIRHRFDRGFDIKVPWELSRFYHLPILAHAYALTADQRYLKEIEFEVSDWVRRNPVGFGVNWRCTMEMAVRVCNWLLARQTLKSSKFKVQSSKLQFKTKNFEKLFLGSLKKHGEFIFKHLEPGHTNHYLADIVGLIYLGVLCPELKEAKKWQEFGVKALEEEMEKQVNTDGCDYESSISYHRLALELFGYSALLCRQNDIKLSDRFWQKLRKMFDFVSFYTKPDGLAPQIGDNDNGQLHKYQVSTLPAGRQDIKYQVNDHRYLFDLAKQIWPDYQSPAPTSKDFSESGYYIMRNKDDYMIISAGGVGTAGLGNHKHNDIFSFELCYQGETFIADPGTYIYTPDRTSRNLFRSTAYHNTVRIDEKETNGLPELELFAMREKAHPKVLKWQSNKDKDIFEAEHYGYQPIIHRRRIIFNKRKKSWTINDFLRGKGQHLVEAYFHLAPNIKAKIKGNRIELIGRKSNLSLCFLGKPELNCEIFNGFVSPSYGLKKKSLIVKFKGKLKLPLNIQFLLQSY